MDNEDFFKARNEYNQTQRMLSKNEKPRKRVSRKEAEQRRNENMLASTKQLRAFTKKLHDKKGFDRKVKKLLTRLHVDVERDKSPFPFWRDLSQSENRLLVKNANQQYVTALAYIAAIFLWLKSLPPNRMEMHLLALMELAGVKKLVSDIHVLSAIHRVIIHQDRDDEKQKANARSTISRDVRAILYLLSEGKSPAGFVSYQEANGGGPDPWYRAYLEKSSPQASDADAIGGAAGGEEQPLTMGLAEGQRTKPVAAAAASPASKLIKTAAIEPEALKVNDKKILECICASPKVCADRAIAHRFKLKSGRYLFTIHVGDESYAGAHIVGAIELGMPGPSASIKMRHLRRFLQPIIERGTPYDI